MAFLTTDYLSALADSLSGYLPETSSTIDIAQCPVTSTDLLDSLIASLSGPSAASSSATYFSNTLNKDASETSNVSRHFYPSDSSSLTTFVPNRMGIAPSKTLTKEAQPHNSYMLPGDSYVLEGTPIDLIESAKTAHSEPKNRPLKAQSVVLPASLLSSIVPTSGNLFKTLLPDSPSSERNNCKKRKLLSAQTGSKKVVATKKCVEMLTETSKVAKCRRKTPEASVSSHACDMMAVSLQSAPVESGTSALIFCPLLGVSYSWCTILLYLVF